MEAKFIYESLEDILKPKSKEEIEKALDKIDAYKVILKDGRRAWIYEEYMRGMAGESVALLTMTDENGKQISLYTKILKELFTEKDYKEIKEWLDNVTRGNYNSAVSWVR
jgi:hypothetical protein